jgi:DNA repair protein RadA/Sms
MGFIAGEVGLAGEVRLPLARAPEGSRHWASAWRWCPRPMRPKPIEGMTVHLVERIEQAMDVVRTL